MVTTMITEPPTTEEPVETPSSDGPSASPPHGVHRDTETGLIGGVCAGVAETTGWDVSLIRIAAVVLGFFSFGIVLYLAAWWLLPDQDDRRIVTVPDWGRGSGSGAGGASRTVGVIAIAVVAVLAAFVVLGAVSHLATGLPGIHRFSGLFPSVRGVVRSALRSWWILALIVGGILILRRSNRPAVPSAGTTPGPTPGAVVTPRSPRPPAIVGPVTLLAAVVLALVMLALRLLGLAAINPGVVAGLVLGVLAVGLLVSSRRGRARGLLLVALPLGLLLALLPLSRARFDAVGRARDLTAADLKGRTSPVEVTAGTWTLDLRGSLRHSVDAVSVRQVAGRVTVVLPTDRRSVVEVETGTGDVDVSRPSIQRATTAAPDGRGLDVATGLVAGSPVTDDELIALETGGSLTPLLVGSPLEARGSVERRTYRTGPTGGVGPDLEVKVRLGVGKVTLVDPRWSGTAPRLATATQMCLTAGGATGVVTPCSQVPSEKRVPVCGSDNEGGWAVVYDCRAITAAAPQVACSDRRWNYVPCASLGIAPDPDFAAVGGAPTGATVPPLGAPFPTGENQSPIPDQVEAGGSTGPSPPGAPSRTVPPAPGQ